MTGQTLDGGVLEEHGEVYGAEARRLQVLCHWRMGSGQRVWSAITNIEELRQWWEDGLLEPREGGRIQLRMDTDECGGLMPQELMDCLANTCLDTCFPIGGKRSKVTRLDFDESEGEGEVLEVVSAQEPIRVVGAGTSICAPLQVP